jgi:site-specific recombinase XerC
MGREHRPRSGEIPHSFTASDKGRADLPTNRHFRSVQLLLGHSKIESTVRYLKIEVDDAIEIAEKIDI